MTAVATCHLFFKTVLYVVSDVKAKSHTGSEFCIQVISATQSLGRMPKGLPTGGKNQPHTSNTNNKNLTGKELNYER